jgi:hypothetical protein
MQEIVDRVVRRFLPKIASVNNPAEKIFEILKASHFHPYPLFPNVYTIHNAASIYVNVDISESHL